MFDFFKKKSKNINPYYKLLDDIYEIEALKPAEFDPYNELFLSQIMKVYSLKIDKYRAFLDLYDETDLDPETIDTVKDSLALEVEGLDWAFDIQNTKFAIMDLARSGVLQSDLKNKIPDANPQHITNLCKRLDADGVIKREKKGSSYYITLP